VVGLRVLSLAERPDLVEAFWSVSGDWPEFMLHDPVADLFYGRAVEQFPDLHLLASDGDDVVGRLHAVPVPWMGLHGLSERGWDWALSGGTAGSGWGACGGQPHRSPDHAVTSGGGPQSPAARRRPCQVRRPGHP